MDVNRRNPVKPTMRTALAVVLVLVAAGAFAWGIRTGLRTEIDGKPEAVKPIATTPPAVTHKSDTPVAVAPQPAASTRVKPTAAPAKAAKPPVVVAPQPKKETVSMKWPYQGGVLRPFGWTYSPTMGDWRFHQGIDIAGNDGDEVVAAMDGRVESIEESALLGTRIVVSHASGLKTVYTGVRDVLVKAGDNVRASQPLAVIGRGSFECLDPHHLHFEVITGKGNVDPGQFLR